jgi:hypothetical protein
MGLARWEFVQWMALERPAALGPPNLAAQTDRARSETAARKRNLLFLSVVNS